MDLPPHLVYWSVDGRCTLMDQETSVQLLALYSKPVSAMAHLLSATTCYPRIREEVEEEKEDKNDCGKMHIAMHTQLRFVCRVKNFIHHQLSKFSFLL